MNITDIIKELKEKQLKRTEESLKLINCFKCKVCNYWVNEEFIVKDICNLCN